MTIEPEILRAGFEKHHLRGLPFSAVLHRITEPDAPGNPHCHPFGFTTHILRGGYVERVYHVEGDKWTSEIIHRTPGSAHYVPATHIHEIIELPDGECWTLILPGPWERESGFWKFDREIQFRKWNEENYQTL